MIFFLCKLLFIGLATGIWAATERGTQRNLHTKVAFFLLGISCSPFIAGLLVLIHAFLGLGLEYYLAVSIFITILCFLYCLLKCFRLVKKVDKRFFLTFDGSWKKQALSLVSLSVILTLGLNLSSKLVTQAEYPLIHHDSLVYGSEARIFVEEGMKWSNIVKFGDFDTKVQPGHPHGFLFQAYLADAFAFDKMNNLPSTWENHEVIQAAFQITFVSLSLAVIAVSILFLGFMGGSVAFSFMFFCYYLQYIVYASSRDAFRIVPLLILISAFHELTKISSQENRRSILVILAMAVFFSIQGHTLNLMIIPMIYLSWFSVNIEKLRNRDFVLSILGWSTLGALLGGLHYLDSYITTGNLMGDGFFYYAYAGTEFGDFLVKNIENFSNMGYIEIFKRIYYNDSYFTKNLIASSFLLVTGTGVACLGTALFFLSKKWKFLNTDRGFYFLSLMLLIILLPLSGLFDFTALPISGALLANNRYLLHWYVFASLVIGVGSIKLIDYAIRIKIFGNLFTIAAIFFFIWAGWQGNQVIHQWHVPSNGARFQDSRFQDLAHINKILKPDDKVLTDHHGVAFYGNFISQSVYSRQNWPLFRMITGKEIHTKLQELGIEYTLLIRPHTNYWEHSPIGTFIQNKGYSRSIYCEPKKRWCLRKLLPHPIYNERQYK